MGSHNQSLYWRKYFEVVYLSKRPAAAQAKNISLCRRCLRPHETSLVFPSANKKNDSAVARDNMFHLSQFIDQMNGLNSEYSSRTPDKALLGGE